MAQRDFRCTNNANHGLIYGVIGVGMEYEYSRARLYCIFRRQLFLCAMAASIASDKTRLASLLKSNMIKLAEATPMT